MKSISKLFIIVSLFTAFSTFCFTACNSGNQTDEGAKSDLYGTFTYQETLGLGDSKLRITHDAEKQISNREYIYSTVYPINYNCEGTNISYNMDQRLKLNRDFTYKYEYTILLSNPGDWGASFARMVVSINGTFDFRETIKEGEYSVILNDPTGGTQTIYASNIGSQNIYDWSMHSKPDMVIDYSAASLVSEYQYDKYVCARMITVDRNDKTVADDIFYTDLLNYITLYSTY